MNQHVTHDAEGQTTHWSMLLPSANDPAEAAKAREYFATRYASVIRSFLRRKLSFLPDGLDLDDLVQGYFAHAFERDLLARAIPERGSFRAYLRNTAESFLIDTFRHLNRQKRRPPGGVASLDRLSDDDEGAPDPPSPDLAPDEQLDREFARAMFDAACGAVEARYRAEGREDSWTAFRLRHFDGVRPAEIAEQLGIGAAAIYSLLHRVKEDVRRDLLAQVAATVGPEDVATELAYLRARL